MWAMPNPMVFPHWHYRLFSYFFDLIPEIVEQKFVFIFASYGGFLQYFHILGVKNRQYVHVSYSPAKIFLNDSIQFNRIIRKPNGQTRGFTLHWSSMWRLLFIHIFHISKISALSKERSIGKRKKPDIIG